MAATVFRYPRNVASGLHEKWIRFDAKTGRHLMRTLTLTEGGTPDTTVQSVVLYLTESVLKSTTSVEWAQNDLGPMSGAVVANLAQTGRAVIDKYNNSSFWDAAAEGVVGIVSGIGTVGSAAGASLLDDVKKIGNEGTFEVISGTKVNPRTDIYFGTQHYRTNEMTFTLIPRNLDEAKEIDGIVHFFQFYMLPSYGQWEATDASRGSLMGFPYEFEINIYSTVEPTVADNDARSASKSYRASIMHHVAKIGRSVLKSVSVDHAGGDKVAFIKDNNKEFYPAVTTLSLSWQECRLLGRRDPEIERSGGDENGVMVFEQSNDPRY